MMSLSYTSGNFHYRTWLVYSNDGLPQISLGLHEQASWMHTHLVFCLSFHKLIALVHPLHGNPYSLTLISIDGHFHSHSEIYCHATFHHSVYYDMLHHCHIALHDHVVDILLVANTPFIIFYTCCS